jgi:hypothetical protein
VALTMPTARELLEQADALMRRNRAQGDAPPQATEGAARAPAADDGIPELTDALAPLVDDAAGPVRDDAGTPLPSPDDGVPPLRQALARELPALPGHYPPPAHDIAHPTLDHIPVLTEIVEEIEAPSIIDLAAERNLGEPSVWMEPGHGEVSVLGPWPSPAGAPADENQRSAGAVPGCAEAVSTTAGGEVGVLHVAAELLDAGGAPAVAQPMDGDDPGRWEAIAERVRVQVLQHIDLFTDTGLQEQLARRLQPIADRASAELVTAISQQVGQLLRACVSDAVEREIEKWRAEER